MTPLLTWTWPETPLAILVICVLAALVHLVVRRAIRLGVEASIKRAEERNAGAGTRAERILADVAGLNHARHQARLRTVGSVLRSISSVLLVTIAVLMVLRELGIPMEPILASAGIGGVALGFGAQSLVKDYLSGIFMILEDQYGVGDLINTGEVTGTVEDVGLRVTRLRDAQGQVWYIRNGEILRLGNQSQGWSTGTIDVPVAYDEDPARIIALLDAVADAVYADPAWDDVLLERPTVAGVNAVQGGSMTIRIFVKTAPNQQWGVQRHVLERSLEALRRAGVRGPAVVPPAL